MPDNLPRPAYDTSKSSSAGESPAEKENAEWIDRRWTINGALGVTTAEPSVALIRNGSARLLRDAATGRITLYANSGGQIIDLLSFEV